MEIEINLWNDYINALKTELLVSGFHLAGTESNESIFIKFYNWRKRKISPIPRKVHRSREFICPPEFAKAITTITEAITCGQDISAYLSKRVSDLSYSDRMINDWGIFHLHLGERTDASGFITRTGPLLFIRVTDTDTYFLNIFPHGAWTKQEIVSIVHENWPETLEQYKLTNVIGVSYLPSDTDVADLRGHDINVILQMTDGTVYAPIGMGTTLSGTGIANDVMLMLTKAQRTFRAAEKAVTEAANNSSQDFGEHTKLKFALESNGIHAHAVEINTRVAYKIW